MIHKDSLGNSDAISDGEVQWMTAGSGILHEERLPASERMLGVQLWLNMPKEHKMAPPEYHSIHADEIEAIPVKGGILRWSPAIIKVTRDIWESISPWIIMISASNHTRN